MKNIPVFVIICCVFAFCVSAQNSKTDKVIEKASQLIMQNKEDKAVETLENAVLSYPDEPSLQIFLGEIYYNRKDYEKSTTYYKKGISLDPKCDLNAYYRLGIMQKQSGDYTQARNNFIYYIDNQKNKRFQNRIDECKYQIECIDFIQEQILNPVEFHPVNLGTNINDTNYQYLPTLTLDNELYLTQRENNTEDFYFAQCNKTSANGQNAIDFSTMYKRKQKLPPPLNTEANEGAASISPDGRYLYFAKCNTKDGMGSCDIYRSKRTGNTWSEPQNLGPNVNSHAWDSQPSIASDGRTLFFASNREGGFGGSDIWYSYLKDDGTWTKAKNCGSMINTAGEEMSPFIHPSNTTLYFASDSLIGMGGQDIYYSKIVSGKFQKPVNMGYPINTSADETCLITSADGEFAVYSKKNGENGFDLYAFNLEKKLRPTKVICLKGKVTYDDNKQGNEAVFEIKNLRNGRIVTSTFSDKATDTYKLALVTGEDYAMNVTCNGYLLYSENFSVKDNEDITDQNFIEKNIAMQSIKEGKSVRLHNIFFATDSFELKEESTAELKTLLKLMNDNPKIRVEISGYTDNVGKDEYNVSLSQKRAYSVILWLTENGIDRNRLRAKGYGKADPVADNSTEEGRRKNRRTEFKIIGQ